MSLVNGAIREDVLLPPTGCIGPYKAQSAHEGAVYGSPQHLRLPFEALACRRSPSGPGTQHNASARYSLKGYIRLYGALESAAQGYVIGLFKKALQGLHKVI